MAMTTRLGPGKSTWKFYRQIIELNGSKWGNIVRYRKKNIVKPQDAIPALLTFLTSTPNGPNAQGHPCRILSDRRRRRSLVQTTNCCFEQGDLSSKNTKNAKQSKSPTKMGEVNTQTTSINQLWIHLVLCMN